MALINIRFSNALIDLSFIYSTVTGWELWAKSALCPLLTFLPCLLRLSLFYPSPPPHKALPCYDLLESFPQHSLTALAHFTCLLVTHGNLASI